MSWLVSGLADENEALRARIAQLEAASAKSTPAPVPSGTSPAPAPDGGKGPSENPNPLKPNQELVAVSLSGADSGKAQAKTGGKIKWI